MCMMLEKPAYYSLPDNYVQSLWRKNSDGFGAYNYETREVFKTLDKTEAENYLLDNHNCRLFIHFRMSTGGDIDTNNIHPFKISDNMILFHNGVLASIYAVGDKSDTHVMCNFFDAFHGEDQEVLDAVTAYLEENEEGSRFTIINTLTNETFTPKCAAWVKHTTKDGEDLLFSNSYAIDTHILYGYSRQVGYTPSKATNAWYDRYDAWQEYEDMQANTQALQEMLDDRSTIRSLVDFIETHPDCVAHFLRDYYSDVASQLLDKAQADGMDERLMLRYDEITGALIDDRHLDDIDTPIDNGDLDDDIANVKSA